MKNIRFKKSSTFGGFLFSIIFLIRAIYWDLCFRILNFINSDKIYKNYKKIFEQKSIASCNMLSFFTGLKFEIDMPDYLPDNFIIISNHQSLADIIIIVNAFKKYNVKFIAKKSLKYRIPLISIYLRVGKHAFVSQKNNFRKTINEIEKMVELTKKENVCPVIFPEGTRSKDGKLGNFHSAALKLICRMTNLPIVSVALDGGFNFSNVYGFINASSKITYRIKALSVYPNPNGKEEVNKLILNIKEEINSQLENWRNQFLQ